MIQLDERSCDTLLKMQPSMVLYDKGRFMTNISNSEKVVIGFFGMGAGLGFGSLIYAAIKNSSPEELTPLITNAFLLSVIANSIRTWANSKASSSEKIIVSLAVFAYLAALVCDFLEQRKISPLLKIATAGCVGLWNVAQTIRLNTPIPAEETRIINTTPSPLPR